MDEDLREKLKSYFSAPADAPINMKFAGWNDDDYKKTGRPWCHRPQNSGRVGEIPRIL